MAGRPPTPPKDEEMEDIPRPARAAASAPVAPAPVAAGPIGAGAGPAPVAPAPARAAAAGPIGAGAGPAPDVPNIENQRSDVKIFLRKIRSIPFADSDQSIKIALQHLIDDEKLKEFIPDHHSRFERQIKGIIANNDRVSFKREVRFEAATLENAVIATAINKGLGMGVGALYGNADGGKRRKTRRNRKSLRKRTNGRKTSHTSKR